MIEENIASLFGLWADLNWIRQVMVFRHPHLEDLMISPVTSRSVMISILRGGIVGQAHNSAAACS